MRIALLAAICYAMSVGCGGTEPSPYELPPPDLSLDPSRLVDPEIAYGCGNWVPGSKPAVEAFLADIDFNRAYALSPPAEGIQWIRDVGGTPLYSFHFSAFRVWIPMTSVEQLNALALSHGMRLSLYVVSSATRYDWPALVKFKDSHPISSALRTLIGTLGGRIDEEYLALNMLRVTIPDRSLKPLRADTRVEYAAANTRFCVSPELRGDLSS